MPEEQKIIPYSLCDDCPIKDECKTSSMPGIVLSCGKRAKHEAPEQQAVE